MPIKQMTPQEETLEDSRFRIRHSAAHVLADAVLELFPEAKYAIGPPVETGFYYDFQLSRPFTPEDLESIEAVMRERMGKAYPFEMVEVTRAEAKSQFADQPFKQEIIDGLPDSESITTCRHGAFLDLCRGRHVETTGDIPAFKLLNVKYRSASAHSLPQVGRCVLQRTGNANWMW